MSGEYRRICAWCGLDLGPAGPEYSGTTHGICPKCFIDYTTQVNTVEKNEMAQTYKPAGRSDICDAYESNPDYGTVVGAPRLIRCRRHATARITIKTAAEVAAVKRCHEHAAELRRRALNGKFEILEDEPVLCR